MTNSCAQVRHATNRQPHCGVCSQCLDRRVAIVAAGVERHDPAEQYAVDLLTGAREEGGSRLMAVGFVETARRIETMDERAFFANFGETSRVLRECPEGPSVTARNVFNLYKRHAATVSRVVVEGLQRYASSIFRRELSSSCLLMLVSPSTPMTMEGESEGPELPDYIFRRKGNFWQIRFAGGDEKYLKHSQGAIYLQELLSKPERTISACDLPGEGSRRRLRVQRGHLSDTIGGSESCYRIACQRVRFLQIDEGGEVMKRTSKVADTRKTVRCAIYTRKSTEEGLDKEFSSLDAQRESAEAYIKSQQHEGWKLVAERYEDGGFTGGNMERPALKRLLRDIEADKIDCVVVYKIDRFSRSLPDFARMMQLFEAKDVSFVSVTQLFNTGSSMGRRKPPSGPHSSDLAIVDNSIVGTEWTSLEKEGPLCGKLRQFSDADFCDRD